MLQHYLMKIKTPKFNITAGYYDENCMRCIIASSKWTSVIMCLKFTYFGCYAAIVHKVKIHDIENLRKRLM